jgi:short-subunit dehydrogenase involved in D-alanine esterification of teichoic acids
MLVNNAGYLTYDATKTEAARETLETNLHGTIDLTEKLWPAFTENAKVVVISSGLGAQSLQGEYVKQAINRSDIKSQDLIALAEEYLKDI